MTTTYKLLCCNYPFSKPLGNISICPYCGDKNPVIHEVDVEDKVIRLGGFSGDKSQEKRPWGSFKVVLDEPRVKVKKITVKPKQRLSLQLHKHRDEWWKIIAGNGEMQIGNSTFLISAWDTVEIEKYQVHRVENTGEVDLVFVEIQTGLCQENDIIRLEDDYERNNDD